MNEAKDMYMTKEMNIADESVCEDTSEITTNKPLYKVEPPEIIEHYENAQPIDENTYENDIICPFEDDEFIPEATIDQRDFDAIFLDDFSTEYDIKTENATPMERYMERTAIQEDIAPEPGPSTSINRTSQGSTIIFNGKILRKLRKRPTESSNVNLICKYCQEPFLSLYELKEHYKEEHATLGIPVILEERSSKR